MVDINQVNNEGWDLIFINRYKNAIDKFKSILDAHAGQIAHINRFMSHSWDKKILA